MYINTATGQYPYTVGDLRRDNRNTSFPKVISEETLAQYGVVEVVESAPVEYDERTQKAVKQSNPTLVDGVWTIGYTIQNKTPQEVIDFDLLAEANNRDKRDELLRGTDWVILLHLERSSAGGPPSDKPVDMINYRQNLRDITDHPNWPNLSDSDWPVKPS